MSKYNLTKTRLGKIIAVYFSLFFVLMSNPALGQDHLPRYVNDNNVSTCIITQQDRQKFKDILIEKGGFSEEDAEKASQKISDKEIRKLLDNPRLIKKTGFIFIILIIIGAWVLGVWVAKQFNKNDKNKKQEAIVSPTNSAILC